MFAPHAPATTRQVLLRSVLPTAVALATGFAAEREGGTGTTTVIACACALGLIYAVRRRPDVICLVALVTIPTVPLLPALLLRLGVPLSVLAEYGHIKDAVCVALVVALATGRRRQGAPDLVELVGMAYLTLITLYLALPIASAGLTAPPLSDRVYGWRFDAEWVVCLLAIRRLVLPGSFLPRVRVVAVGLAGLELLTCGLETAAPAAYNRYLLGSLDVGKYLNVDLKDHSRPAADLTTYNVFNGTHTVRAGGLELNPLATGAICIVLVAVLAPAIRGRRLAPLQLAGLGASLAAAGLTLTRSAVLGCAVAFTVILVGAFGDRMAPRARVALLTVMGVAVAAPTVVGSRLAARIAAGLDGSDASVVAHQRQSSGALSLALHQYLGAGLGTSPAVGLRFDTLETTAENAYLQTSLELGVAGLVLFVLLLVSLLRAVPGTPNGEAPDRYVVRAAICGLLAMSFFLDPWIDYGLLFLVAIVTGAGTPYSRGLRQPAVGAARPETGGRGGARLPTHTVGPRPSHH